MTDLCNLKMPTHEQIFNLLMNIFIDAQALIFLPSVILPSDNWKHIPPRPQHPLQIKHSQNTKHKTTRVRKAKELKMHACFWHDMKRTHLLLLVDGQTTPPPHFFFSPKKKYMFAWQTDETLVPDRYINRYNLSSSLWKVYYFWLFSSSSFTKILNTQTSSNEKNRYR